MAEDVFRLFDKIAQPHLRYVTFADFDDKDEALPTAGEAATLFDTLQSQVEARSDLQATLDALSGQAAALGADGGQARGTALSGVFKSMASQSLAEKIFASFAACIDSDELPA